MANHKPLTDKSLKSACKNLAAEDSLFTHVFEKYGVPPMWDRPQSFQTLLHIILEQQVSLASARACVEKLQNTIGEIEPNKFLTLNDFELKAIGFSRQKTSYGRGLAEALLEKRLDLDNLHHLPDEEVKIELKKLKGIGDWTADIYLLMVLLRPDIMPRGDIALHEAYRKLNGHKARPDSDKFIKLAKKWSPYRSVAARLLWHFYLSERRNK